VSRWLLAAFALSLTGCRVLWGAAATAVVVIDEACDVLAPVDPKAKKICADVRELESILAKIFAWQERKNLGPALYKREFDTPPRKVVVAAPSRPVIVELPDGMTAADLDGM
jgi:hypothetical protein